MTPHQGTGNLAEAGFCEILARLSRGRETGVLHLSGPAAGKSVYLQQGSVVFASSQDPDDRLGEMLLTRGVISREQWEQAAGQVGPGKRLGTVLVERGFLPAAELPRWVREQVKEIIFSLFSWTEGEYRFEPGPFPSSEAITLRISTAEIFLSGLRRVQKWSVLRRGTGEIRIPYRLSPDYRETLGEVVPEKEEKRLLALLESKPLTMEQAALESGLSTLRVYQLFYAFRALGIIVPAEVVVSVPRAQEAEAPQLDQGATLQIAVPTHLLPSPRPALATMSGALTTGGLRSSAVEEAQTSAPPAAMPDVGAQTVMLRMPLIPPAAPAGNLAQSPTPESVEAAPGALQVLRDGDPPEASVSTPPTPARRPSTRSEDASSRPGSAPGPADPSRQESSSITSGAKRKNRMEYRVIRMEAEKLEDNGAQSIEELLRQWTSKGYQFAGVVGGRASGFFGSTGPFFFIFTRDNPS